jgi:hypothetical protein
VLAELVEREFASAGQVLAVNARAEGPANAVRVEEPNEGDTPAQGYDGAFWECQGDPLAGLRSLRKRVRPSGLLLVSVRRREPAWERLRRAFSGDPLKLPSLEALCAAPILLGLEAPRVLVDSPELTVLTARVPTQPDALDAHFD